MNGVGHVPFHRYNTLDEPALVARQAAVLRKLPHRQLLALNYANDYVAVKKTHPAVSVLNFHYSFPPAVVPLNWSLNKPICFDETSDGHKVLERRREAWAFMLSGGAVYNNLDPSFATDDPTGSGRIQQTDGRFDGRPLRKHLRILREFMESLDFIHMQPDQSAVAIPPHPGRCYALVKSGQAVAVYIHSPRKEPKA